MAFFITCVKENTRTLRDTIHGHLSARLETSVQDNTFLSLQVDMGRCNLCMARSGTTIPQEKNKRGFTHMTLSKLQPRQGLTTQPNLERYTTLTFQVLLHKQIILAISNLYDFMLCSIKILTQKLIMKMSSLVDHKKAQSLPFRTNLFHATRVSISGVTH